MKNLSPPVPTRQEPELRPPLREIVVLPVTPITATSAASAQVLLTIPDGRFFQITSFKVCNTNTSAQTFTMYIVPSGGSAGTGNTIYSAESIPANDTLTPSAPNTIMVDGGSTIEVIADAANHIKITLFGVQISGGDPL